MVVRNSTAYPQTLWKITPVARAVTATPLTQVTNGSPVAGGGNELKDPHAPKLTVRQWHGKLFDELDLSGLDSWPLEMADAAYWLLAKYHDVFLLDPMESYCTEHK